MAFDVILKYIKPQGWNSVLTNRTVEGQKDNLAHA
jgi:hypothetical protein